MLTSKRPDGILDEVVVDVDPAVVHVALQTGKKTVGIGKGLSACIFLSKVGQ